MAARTIALLSNLAVVYEAQGRLDDSASLGEESLAMYQRIHGSKLTVVLSNEGVECYNQISLHVTVEYYCRSAPAKCHIRCAWSITVHKPRAEVEHIAKLDAESGVATQTATPYNLREAAHSAPTCTRHSVSTHKTLTLPHKITHAHYHHDHHP